MNKSVFLTLAAALALLAMPAGAQVQQFHIDDGVPVTDSAAGWIDTWGDSFPWNTVSVATPTGDTASETPGDLAQSEGMGAHVAGGYPVSGQMIVQVGEPPAEGWATAQLRLREDGGNSAILQFPFHAPHLLILTIEGGAGDVDQADISGLEFAPGDWARMTVTVDETTVQGFIEKWDGSAWSEPASTAQVEVSEEDLPRDAGLRLHLFMVASEAYSFLVDYAAHWDYGPEPPDDVRNPVDAADVSVPPVQDGVITAGEYGPLAPVTITADNAFQVDWGGTVPDPDPEDLSYDIYSAWDADALYIALDVTDDVVNTAEAVWSGGEMIQIVLAHVDGVAREAGSLADITLAPGRGIVWQNNAGGGDVDWGDANITGSWQATATGYVLEVRFPWEDFNWALPPIEVGAEIKALFAVVDHNAEGEMHAFMISTGGPNANPFENHADLSTLTLVASVTVEVPDVLEGAESTTLSEAEAVLAAAGLQVGEITQDWSDTIPVGMVMGQSPEAGAQVAEGSAVDLIVSAGPMPDMPVGGTAALVVIMTGIAAVGVGKMIHRRMR